MMVFGEQTAIYGRETDNDEERADIDNTPEDSQKISDIAASLTDESPALEFDRFVQAAEEASASEPKDLLRILRPVWAKVDRLRVAQRGILACAQNLGWVFEPDAVTIADLIRESYLAFPEIDRSVGQTGLVETVVALEGGGSALHCAIVASRIDPEHRGARQALIFNLCRYGHFKTAGALLDRLPADHGRDRLISRILQLPSFKQPSDASIVRAFADRLSEHSSLAGFHLGNTLGRTFFSDASVPIEPVSLVSSVAKVRRLVRAGIRPAHTASRSDDRLDVAELLERILGKYGPEMRTKARRSSRPAPLVPVRPSGVVSWFDHVLDEDGVVSFPLTDFRTVSGMRAPDGTIVGSGTDDDAPLLFGPYVTLQPGLYRVTFLGEIAPHAAVAMAVTSDYGSVVLGTSMAFADESRAGEIANLTFEIRQPMRTCEFVLKVRPNQGRVVVRGVSLRRSGPAASLRSSAHAGKAAGTGDDAGAGNSL